MQEETEVVPVISSSKLSDRRWIESLVYSLMINDDPFFGVFTRQCGTYVFHDDIRSGNIAYIGVHPQRGLVLGMNREIEKIIPPEAQREILKHEILHAVHGHIISELHQDLSKKYGKMAANVAADLSINQHIKLDALKNTALAPADIHDPQFNFPPNLTTAEYCKLLEKKFGKRSTKMMEIEVPAEWLQGEKPGQSGDSEEGKEGKDGKSGKKVKVKVVYERLENVGKDKNGNNAKPASAAAVRQAVKEALSRAMKASKKGRGLFGGEASEFIDSLSRPPTVPWISYLRRAEARAKSVKRVQTLYKTSRRNPIHLGFKRSRKFKVWFGIDTSGSMGAEDLRLIDAECRGIVARGAELTVFHQDAEIAKEEVYRRGKTLNQFFGRGGTDFSPIFLKLLETPAMAKPSLVVVFTDGYGDLGNYFAKVKEMNLANSTGERTPDGIRVLWLLTAGGSSVKSLRQIAPFGTIVKMDDLKKGST